jgi:hypothetical protein
LYLVCCASIKASFREATRKPTDLFLEVEAAGLPKAQRFTV